MRIIFVRHGEPDYKTDCLTEKGARQAENVSVRLLDEGISRIYASPLGRARQTAQPLADKLDLPVQVLPFMREICWNGPDGKLYDDGGHPWLLGDRMLGEDELQLTGEEWRHHPYFENNCCVRNYDEICAGIDGLLSEHGFERQGSNYLCKAENEETVVLFSHGGSGACALSHLFNLPFPFVCAAMPYDFTSVIILTLPVYTGKHVYPQLTLFNDIAHNRGEQPRAGRAAFQR
ncbi:MAG: hypothetical protein CW338_10770 [Clostridiales bacterium]|nr:hypothetical protein [Clostridiales bacterium]